MKTLRKTLRQRLLFLAGALAVAATLSGNAAAEQYKWTDRNGRVQYGDVPPPGVKATRLKDVRSAPAASEPKADTKGAAAKDASKGPLTPAEQEAEYRKRQIEAQKAREKEEKSAQESEAKRINCANAQEQLRVLESGQRIAKTGPDGERQFVDDDQRAAGIARARKSIGQWCG